MYKFAKYYVFLNLYQNAKRNVFIVLVSVVFFFVFIFLFTDLITMAQGNEKYVFIIAKWIVLLTILMVIGWNIRVALRKVKHPFKKESLNEISDARKEKLLAKERLQSKHDLILKKYKSIK